jgi:ACR3 family arsenite transporter
VLVEVPVMLSLVAIVNASKGWYERGAGVSRPAAAIEAERG